MDELRVDTEPSGAVFAEDRTHRLYLWRRWDKNLPWIMFIGLNPSKADDRRNDPTIRREIGFAVRWGYGGLFKFNAFTLVSTDPAKLNTETPLVMGADLAMRVARKRCDKAVAAWGALITKVRSGEDRIERIKRQLSPLDCLGKTKLGHPRHPLYVPYSVELVTFSV